MTKPREQLFLRVGRMTIIGHGPRGVLGAIIVVALLALVSLVLGLGHGA